MDPDVLKTLATIATVFSGGQLAVIVFIFMELRSLSKVQVALKAQTDGQDKHINQINARLSNVMGRLKLPYTEEELT